MGNKQGREEYDSRIKLGDLVSDNKNNILQFDWQYGDKYIYYLHKSGGADYHIPPCCLDGQHIYIRLV